MRSYQGRVPDTILTKLDHSSRISEMADSIFERPVHTKKVNCNNNWLPHQHILYTISECCNYVV